MVEEIKRMLKEIPELMNKTEIRVAPISGGLTNLNYKITADESHYFLRTSSFNTQLLNIDRLNEFQAMESAYKLGITPEVIYFDRKKGYILSRFVDGHELTKKQYCEISTLEKIVDYLRSIHNSKPIEREFNPFIDIKTE